MKFSLERPISERSLTRVVICYLVLAPVSFGLYLGGIPGNGGNSFTKMLFAVLWLLPPSLLVCSIAAVVFHWLKWRQATWVNVLIPPMLIGISIAMILLGLVSPLDGA